MEQFEQYRAMMFAIAYRMLGSAMEAEDIVQEAYLRYQAIESDTIQSHRAFLGTVITRLCLDHLKSAKVQRETYIGSWLPEPILTDGHPEVLASDHESISTAFLVLLESLTPVERAVFLLREVFDYDYSEIAKIVDKSEGTCRKLFSRAKQHIRDNRPRFETTPNDQQALFTKFMYTVSTGDMDTLMTMLMDDVVLYSDGGGKVFAAKRPVIGRDLVAKFLINVKRLGDNQEPPDGYHIEFVQVNGQIGLMVRESGVVNSLFTAEIAQGKIKTLYVQRNPDKLKHL